MIAGLWIPATVGFAISLALTPLMELAAPRVGLVDRPSRRSSHTRATPRGGGIAVVIAVAVALAAAPSIPTSGRSALTAGAVAIALIGFGGDRFDLSPLFRLIGQIVVAGIVAWHLGGLPQFPLPSPLDLALGWIAVPVAAVWIVCIVNIYNFMDGIDGLAGLQAIVTGAGIALCGWDPLAATTGAAIVGACLAFLLFNWAPARLFLGDTGSLFLGYAFATLPLAAPVKIRSNAAWFAAVSMWLFLADATWTRLKLMARGGPWHRPHREHIYQRLTASGWGHGRTAALVGTAGALITLGGLLAWQRPSAWCAWLVCGLATVLFLIELQVARWREAKR